MTNIHVINSATAVAMPSTQPWDVEEDDDLENSERSCKWKYKSNTVCSFVDLFIEDNCPVEVKDTFESPCVYCGGKSSKTKPDASTVGKRAEFRFPCTACNGSPQTYRVDFIDTIVRAQDLDFKGDSVERTNALINTLFNLLGRKVEPDDNPWVILLSVTQI